MTFIHTDTFNYLKNDVFQLKKACLVALIVLVLVNIYTVFELNRQYNIIYALNEEVEALKSSESHDFGLKSNLESSKSNDKMAENIEIMMQQMEKIRLSIEKTPISKPETRTIIKTETVRDTLFIPVITPVFADFNDISPLNK